MGDHSDYIAGIDREIAAQEEENKRNLEEATDGREEELEGQIKAKEDEVIAKRNEMKEILMEEDTLDLWCCCPESCGNKGKVLGATQVAGQLITGTTAFATGVAVFVQLGNSKPDIVAGAVLLSVCFVFTLAMLFFCVDRCFKKCVDTPKPCGCTKKE